MLQESRQLIMDGNVVSSPPWRAGKGDVFKGLDLGTMGMKERETRQLTIPADEHCLHGCWGIPKSSTGLILTVECLKVGPHALIEQLVAELRWLQVEPPVCMNLLQAPPTNEQQSKLALLQHTNKWHLQQLQQCRLLLLQKVALEQTIRGPQTIRRQLDAQHQMLAKHLPLFYGQCNSMMNSICIRQQWELEKLQWEAASVPLQQLPHQHVNALEQPQQQQRQLQTQQQPQQEQHQLQLQQLQVQQQHTQVQQQLQQQPLLQQQQTVQQQTPVLEGVQQPQQPCQLTTQDGSWWQQVTLRQGSQQATEVHALALQQHGMLVSQLSMMEPLQLLQQHLLLVLQNATWEALESKLSVLVMLMKEQSGAVKWQLQELQQTWGAELQQLQPPQVSAPPYELQQLQGATRPQAHLHHEQQATVPTLGEEQPSQEETASVMEGVGEAEKHEHGTPARSSEGVAVLAAVKHPDFWIYAVRRGRCPGVYDDIHKAEEQLAGYAGAQCCLFRSREQASRWVEGNQDDPPAWKWRTRNETGFVGATNSTPRNYDYGHYFTTPSVSMEAGNNTNATPGANGKLLYLNREGSSSSSSSRDGVGGDQMDEPINHAEVAPLVGHDNFTNCRAEIDDPTNRWKELLTRLHQRVSMLLCCWLWRWVGGGL